MAYEKQVWQSNELITTDKLNHMEDGIAAINNLDAEDVGAINESYAYDPAAYPYTGQELILLHNPTTGENTVTDVSSFLSAAGGGSGTSQGALVHYTKQISLSAGSTSQTFSDSNITENMVVLQATIAVPSAQGGDWSFTTSDGSVTLNGTVNAATNVTLYFGVSMSAAPSIQVNLASTTADNILKTNPTPGVMGVLGTGNGGTGANSPAGACAALAPGIPTASYDEPTSFESGVRAYDITSNTVRCIQYGNGLKRIVGIFTVNSDRASSGKLFTVPSKYSFAAANNGSLQQGWGFMGRRGSNNSYPFRFPGTEFHSDVALPAGSYVVDYLYF